MSNFARAVKALNDVDEAIDHLADNEAYVTALQAAGLLMPDLPEPEVRHLEEVNTDVLAWKSDHIEVGVYKNRIAMDDPLKESMSPAEARELAYALFIFFIFFSFICIFFTTLLVLF